MHDWAGILCNINLTRGCFWFASINLSIQRR
nr:MAG TPA: hypothetical protein [Caudoviricetes sp.]